MKFSEETTVCATTGTVINRRYISLPKTECSKKVLLLHGQGDHIACHDWAAGLLVQAGFSPEGFDWPGHGQSSGRRGDIPDVDTAIQLIDEVIDKMESPPVGIFAHSTGGFVLLRYLDRKIRLGESLPFRWIWLNSPLIHPAHNQSPLKQRGAKWLGKYFPRLTFSTGVTRKQCCHLEGAEKGDKRINFEGCHNRISLRYGNSLLGRDNEGLSGAIPIPDPLRLLFTQGDEDPICPPPFAVDFFDKVPTPHKTVVLIKGARHEAFREANTLSFFNSVTSWLNQQD